MESLYLLIPVSLIFCVLAVAIFFWAVNNGQYDDLDGEGERVLFDEVEPAAEKTESGDKVFEPMEKSPTDNGGRESGQSLNNE